MRFLPALMLLLSLICGPLWPHDALAQEAVTLRTGQHDDYARLVFEWPVKPQYTISKEGNRLTLRFGLAGNADMGGVTVGGNIVKVETVSTASEPLQIAVTIPDGSRFRDFTVANKVILDVYNPPGANPPKPQEKATTPSPAPAPGPDADVETPAKDFSVAPAESATPAPVEKVDTTKVEAPAMGDHIVSLTSTSNYGVAAFIRSGVLWIVADNPALDAKPIITGPQKDRFETFTEEKIDGGIAFRLNLPDGLKPWADGGGVNWRIHLSSKEKDMKPAALITENGVLSWALSDMRKIIKIKDPLAGDEITVITATHADQFAGKARNFVQLRQLNSVIGLAFLRKADDVDVKISGKNVIVQKPGGLSLSTGAVMPIPPTTPTEDETQDEEGMAPQPDNLPTSEELQKLSAVEPSGNNIYNFPRWEMGGVPALQNNMRLITLDTSGEKEADRVESIITMAKLNIANNRAPEALGLLRIAEQFVPELTNNDEYRALHGAASALAGKYDVAFEDYTSGNLMKFADVPYWRAYTLAGLEDWKQAIDTMPKTFEGVRDYPKSIRIPLELTFAEIALRGANVPLAEAIMNDIRPFAGELPIQYKAALDYLTGEAERQKGNPAKAVEYWEPLANGRDYLYRAKAGLSLTRLQLDRKEITPAQAIDRLEALRYAWRGDELETLINFRLGEMYVENKDYLKAFTILRNALEIANTRDLANEIDAYMKKSFREVFTKDQLKSMNPLEAISFYEEFKDLTPPGAEGNQFVETLAERLVNADLLGRAASLLEYQVNNRLQGDKKAEIAIRLAAIRLLDGNPDGALRSLDIAQKTLNGADQKPAPGTEKTVDIKVGDNAQEQSSQPLIMDAEKQRQINLLRARALSMQKKTDEAIAVLEGMKLDPDVNRLRTDIAWAAGKWEEAAVALNDLIITENINPRSTLNEYQTGLILNRAIALNLSNDRVALANLRQRHNEQMDKTDKGKMFEVITRPRRPDMIGSREAIESMISELSLFQGFLDGYGKLTEGEEGRDAKEPAPVQEPVPANATPDEKAAEE